MLPEETFAAIVHLAKETVPQIVPAPNEPNGAYYVRSASGELKLIEPKIAHDKHLTKSIETLSAIARRNNLQFQVWYSNHQTVLRYGNELANATTLKYGESEQMRKIREWERSGTKYKHQEFVLMLRTLFADCQRRCPDLIPSVREVKFKTLQESASNVQSKNVSIGKRLESEVAGTKSLPDDVMLEVPYFDSVFDRNVEIRCVLDVDAQAETFRLIPIPGDTEGASDLALNHIKSQLREVFNDEDFEEGRILQGEY